MKHPSIEGWAPPGLHPDPRQQRRLYRRGQVGAILHRLHRRAGVFAAGFLLWLASSGLLMNEAPLLGLDHQRIAWPWLMQLYGLQPEVPQRGYAAGGSWLVPMSDGLRWAEHAIADPALGPVCGAVVLDGVVYIAMREGLLLLKADNGERVDLLRAEALPATPIRRIAVVGERLLIEAGGGHFESVDALDWHPQAAADGIQWSEEAPLPSAVAAPLVQAPSLPAERVLHDVHSGRIAGSIGARVIDFTGVLAIILAVTGLWSMLRRTRRA